ncbi:hypothetical protein RB653_004300 [Dictyostelium firmibasis]|uniref:EF-hand domain-containing protein n=1 Tax=Dictyostelium firmibasis TaxID=79012 RepID=A0AAN7U7K5_9MYCE
MTKSNTNKLTDDQVSEIKESFDMFKSGNGKMDYEQIKYAFRALGVEPTEETLESTKKKGQKSMTYNTFFDIVSPFIPKRDSMSTLEQAFKLFDRDESGTITFQDLKSVAINIGEECSDKDLYDMIEFADIDGDGVINKSEFISLMTTKKVL